jgi:hypothetical protein
MIRWLFVEKYSSLLSKCPSPDGSGYPFVPAFGTKDRNEQQEIASKKIYSHLKNATAIIYIFIYQQFAQL